MRTTHGLTYFPERIKNVVVHVKKCAFGELFSANFRLIFARLERSMAFHKKSFETTLDYRKTAHVAQIIVEGFESGSDFDYRELEMTGRWRWFSDSGNQEVLGIAYSNMLLLDNVFVVSCSNNDNIMNELAKNFKFKRFQYISCD